MSSHISKDTFFYIIEQRLFRYIEAIFGNRGMGASLASVINCNSEKMKSLASQDNYFGEGFWGYGINTICDGNELMSHLDVEEIKYKSASNKHSEKYRNLLVLVFKVDGDFLFVSTFSIDSCQVGVEAKINTKYYLKDLENARISNSKNKILVEFIIKGLSNPILFQIDDYSFPQNLSNGQLAKYYIDKIKEISAGVLKEKVIPKQDVRLSFINDFIEGIHKLQKSPKEKSFITSIKNKGTGRDEAPFRDWFNDWFSGRKYRAEVEAPKGNGRIDLRVCNTECGEKIIEFKGWWNENRKDVVKQVNNYLTEFEGDAYIFMINHLKSPIIDKYKIMLCKNIYGYVEDTWQAITFGTTDYLYYSSIHKIGNKSKTVYHFIFTIW